MSLSAECVVIRRQSGPQRGTKGDQLMRSIVCTVRAYPYHGVSQLAKMLNLSASRLSHLFKSATGYSLRSFLIARRLERAAELLVHTAAPVKEVAYAVGYGHPPSFARAFRNKFGCTPNQHRFRQQAFPKNSRFG